MDNLAAEPTAPDSRPRFRDLLRRVLEGSDDAARQLQEHYGSLLMRVVRRRLPQRLRTRFDSMDFVQDVWTAFFGIGEHSFETPEHLLAYLVQMARNKVADAARAGLTADKRSAAREEPLPAWDAALDGDEDYFARDDTPSQAAIGEETWLQMLAGQPAAFRAVLSLLHQGMTQTEVAERLHLSKRTVQRILQRALERTQS